MNGRPFEFDIVTWRAQEELDDRLRGSGVEVAYVSAGHRDHLATVRTVARDLGILTLGAESDYVGAGVSIGLGLKQDRPQIWVDLESLHQEGQTLDARILRLCKVVEPR